MKIIPTILILLSLTLSGCLLSPDKVFESKTTTDTLTIKSIITDSVKSTRTIINDTVIHKDSIIRDTTILKDTLIIHTTTAIISKDTVNKKDTIIKRDTIIRRDTIISIIVQRDSSSLMDSLVAWYPFNGNANDASGHGNNGVVTGATLTMDKKGNANSAYYFTTGDAITIPDITLPPGNFSVSFWFKPDSLATVGGSRIVSFGDDANPHSPVGFSTAYWNSNRFEAVQNSGGVTTSGTNYYNIQFNNYYHIVYVCSLTVAKLYINGGLVSDTTVTVFPGSTGTLRIGGWSVWTFNKGAIDDIRIYHRNLSSFEVTSLYKELQ